MTKQAKYLAQSYPKDITEEQFVQECQHFKMYLYEGGNNNNKRNHFLHQEKQVGKDLPKFRTRNENLLDSPKSKNKEREKSKRVKGKSLPNQNWQGKN